jgi:ABC transport system ATP-binding/permease protein
MPAPILLNCENVTKTYGARPLFRGLTFTVFEGDRVGLVGPNAAGKSTLLKILAGLETPDSGSCTRRKNLRVGYVPQHPVFEAGQTVEEIIGPSSQAAEMLAKAGFADPTVGADTLSGGWRARLAIASALARDPDILLLDEPTNHLDLDSVLWLESTLSGGSTAFVVVSHDRYFLQNVAHRMLEIDRVYADGVLAVAGAYAELLEARDLMLSQQAAYEQSLANRVRREVAWLRRGAKARTTKSKARIQSAERSIGELKESRERGETASAGIDFASSGRRTKRLWSCTQLAKSFGQKELVGGLDLLLTAGMRLGVLGANGSGKTTLLRLIVGELQPDSGTVFRADGLRVVYFDQSRRSVDPEVTLRRALAPAGDSVIHGDRALHVAGWARRFLFRPEQLDTTVSRLSGGERARIALARVMLQPADLLVLDEPTNDLDIPTLEVLEDSLLEFQGALVLVTHDRHLIDRVSTAVVALDGRGGVERYADYSQWEADRRDRSAAGSKAVRAPVARPPASARRLSYHEQREWAAIEDRLHTADAHVAAARLRAEDPSIASDALTLQARLDELTVAQQELDRVYARWAELEEKLKGVKS